VILRPPGTPGFGQAGADLMDPSQNLPPQPLLGVARDDAGGELRIDQLTLDWGFARHAAADAPWRQKTCTRERRHPNPSHLRLDHALYR
jgi:hypothetical protein